MLSNRLIAYAQFDMQRTPKPAQVEMKLPLFNLFRDNPFKREPEQTESDAADPLEELPPPEPTE